jgi:putative peptide zinc metalloprotease protein
MSAINTNLNLYDGFEHQFPFDSSDRTEQYLVIDRHGTHIRVSPSAYLLLSAARSGTSFEDLAKLLNAQSSNQQPVTPALLRQSYERLVKQLSSIERNLSSQKLPWGFWLRLPLLSQGVVEKIVSTLTFLYVPWVALLALPLVVLLPLYYAFFRFTPAAGQHEFLYAYCLFILSLVVHEFGHAAACARYGARPNDIGFAMYLIYPALYSDVTSAWRLSRAQRVVVDLGGCYFQLLLGAGLLLLFRLTGWVPFRISVLLIVYTCIFSLNPIFKFDGYWVLTDALGVPNLGQQVAHLRRYFWCRLRGRSVEPLPWSSRISLPLLLYSIVSSSVWVLFAFKLVPVLSHATRIFLSQSGHMAMEISAGRTPSLEEFKDIFGAAYFLVVIAAMIFQLMKRALKHLKLKQPARSTAVAESQYEIAGYDT